MIESEVYGRFRTPKGGAVLDGMGPAIPGPTVVLVIPYTLGHGRKPAAAIVAGVALGDLTAMTASMLGLGAVLATSALVFAGLRWIGGAYLIYFGIMLWRVPVRWGVEAVLAFGWRWAA